MMSDNSVEKLCNSKKYDILICRSWLILDPHVKGGSQEMTVVSLSKMFEFSQVTVY